MAHMVSAPALASGTNTSGVIAALRARFAKYMEYRSTIRELDKLSDRELEDIGLARCTIESAARYHTYG